MEGKERENKVKVGAGTKRGPKIRGWRREGGNEEEKRTTEQDKMRTERGTRAKLLRKMNAGKDATDKKQIEAKLMKHNRRHDYIERE